MDVSNGYMWKKKKRCQAFPWMKDILENIAKSFPNIQESTALQLLHECVEKELQTIFANDENERAGNLYVLLSTFFINFCWKMKWKENEKYLKDLATKLLCYLLYLDIYLCKSEENPKIDRLLFIFKLLPDNSIVYDTLLLINNLNDKERKFFGLLLRYVLCRERLPSISDPVVYIKVLLLFRRLKQMIQKNRRDAVVFIASTITQPPDTLSWLTSLHLENASDLGDTNIIELIFNKNLSKTSLQLLRKAALNEEYLAWAEKLQNIKTNSWSSSITNIQGVKSKENSKDAGENGSNEEKCEKDIKKVKPNAKKSKTKHKIVSDDLPKRKKKKAKLHKKKEKLSKSDKNKSSSKTRKKNGKKLKVLSIHEIKNEIPVPDSRVETESEWFDRCIVCEKNKEKKQIASDCENENQNSMKCDHMNKLDSSLLKDSCELNQLTVINSKPSSVHNNSINKPESSISEDIYKCDLFESDTNNPSFIEDAETYNSLHNMNDSELCFSTDTCQLNLSSVNNFSQCENDFVSSIDVVNETELFCLQESCHLTQSNTNENFINMPTIISELDDRENESVAESQKNMPVLVPELLEKNAEDTYSTVDKATVAELKLSPKKDCQTDKLKMNSNDCFTRVENYLLDDRNFSNASCSTNYKNASETLQTVEKQFDERSCQTDELIMSSNEYFMTAGNYILHDGNQNSASYSTNSKNALPINENEPHNSNAVCNLSQIDLGEDFQMNQCLPENEDSNYMIPPSQDLSYFQLNRAGGLHSNNAIHQNLPPSETERNSNFSMNIHFGAHQNRLDESNITTINKKRILDKIHVISRSSQSSDTDVTEILPLANHCNKNQTKSELELGRRMLNAETQILETNTGIHSQRPLGVKKNNNSVNHSSPAEAKQKSYLVEHVQHIIPASGMSSEDASHFSCELSSTDFDPELVPGHDENSSSCKRKIPLDKRKRCTKKALFKPKNNSKEKNGTIINHYNISDTTLNNIDDIIANIKKIENNFRANPSCLQNNKYHFLNQNEMPKAKNSYSLAEQEEYNCCKENICSECTNVSPSVSDDTDNLNQMIQSHKRQINVYNIVYVSSNMPKDAAVSSNLLIEGNVNTSSDKDSSKKKNLSHSSVENNANVSHLTSEAEENIFLMKGNANMPNITDIMSSTVHLENNISNSTNFGFNQNQLNGLPNKNNPEIVSHRSTTLSQGGTRKTMYNSTPNDVLRNADATRNLIFQQNSLNSNSREQEQKVPDDSCHNIHYFTSSPEPQMKTLNYYLPQDCVVYPASQLQVNLGERLPENDDSSFQKDEMAFSNQCKRTSCVNSPILPRQSTNKFLDGIPITSGHRKSYPNPFEMNLGINNKSLVETQVNNGNISNSPRIGESIVFNADITEETGENNVNCNSNSPTDCPRISTDGFTTDGSDFHSPDSSDSNSSFESNHSKKSKKSSQQNLPQSVENWEKLSVLKPSKFQIYSCDNDSDTSSDDFIHTRKRPAPENKTPKSSCKRKVPVNKRRKRTLFNESRQYFLRSRDSISAPKKITDEIL